MGMAGGFPSHSSIVVGHLHKGTAERALMPPSGCRGTFTVCGRSTACPPLLPARCDLRQRPAATAVWGTYGARS
jgi:hypothetical protein